MSAQQGAPWGRVADDGTVYVRTADGERSVGQFAEGTPEEALKFFTDRYDALAFEVELLEQRIKGGALSPDEAVESVRTVRSQVVDAHAVGDLDSLVGRLDAMSSVIDTQREERRAERAQRVAESRQRKEAIEERIIPVLLAVGIAEVLIPDIVLEFKLRARERHLARLQAETGGRPVAPEGGFGLRPEYRDPTANGHGPGGPAGAVSGDDSRPPQIPGVPF